jgi:hypothetical protein
VGRFAGDLPPMQGLQLQLTVLFGRRIRPQTGRVCVRRKVEFTINELGFDLIIGSLGIIFGIFFKVAFFVEIVLIFVHFVSKNSEIA